VETQTKRRKVQIFDEGIAEDLGSDAAVVINTLIYWLGINAAKRQTIADGYIWTYNSANGWTNYIHYMNAKKIWRILSLLAKAGWVVRGCYNKAGWDRTYWYRMSDKFYETYPEYERPEEIAARKMGPEKAKSSFDESIFKNTENNSATNNGGTSHEDNTHFPNVEQPSSKGVSPIPYLNSVNQDLLGAGAKSADSKKQEQEAKQPAPEPEQQPKTEQPKQEPEQPKQEAEPQEDYERVEEHWRDNYTAIFDHPPVNPDLGKVRRLIKQRLAQISVTDILTILDRGKDDKWIVGKGYSLLTMLSGEVVNRLRDGYSKAREQTQDSEPEQSEAFKQYSARIEQAKANKPTHCLCGEELVDNVCPKCGRMADFSHEKIAWEFIKPMPPEEQARITKKLLHMLK
jgi:hypothetical protein